MYVLSLKMTNKKCIKQYVEIVAYVCFGHQRPTAQNPHGSADPSFNGHDTIQEFHLRIPGDTFKGAADAGDH